MDARQICHMKEVGLLLFYLLFINFIVILLFCCKPVKIASDAVEATAKPLGRGPIS